MDCVTQHLYLQNFLTTKTITHPTKQQTRSWVSHYWKKILLLFPSTLSPIQFDQIYYLLLMTSWTLFILGSKKLTFSRKNFSAATSNGREVLSGWYSFDRRLYAAFISSNSASAETPRYLHKVAPERICCSCEQSAHTHTHTHIHTWNCRQISTNSNSKVTWQWV